MKVVGLDLSLTGAGVATVQDGQATVREYGSASTTADLRARGLRIRGLASPIIRDCLGADLVLVEDLFMGPGTGKQLDRAGLWWVIVASLTSRGIPTVEVTNNHLKMYALGKGGGKGTDKDHVLAAVVRRYPQVEVTSNNTADALVLACAGARYLGEPVEPDLPATHVKALAAIKWPQLNRKEQHA